MLAELIAYEFIMLHGLDGRSIYVNPRHIVSVADAAKDGKLLVSGNCVVSMIDRKFLTVAESCDSIRERLKEIRK